MFANVSWKYDVVNNVKIVNGYDKSQLDRYYTDSSVSVRGRISRVYLGEDNFITSTKFSSHGYINYTTSSGGIIKTGFTSPRQPLKCLKFISDDRKS